jgi:hypothetical protein
LLKAAIESVARLEILLMMRRDRPRSTTAKALAHVLSMRGAEIDTHLAVLCGRGFLGVTIANDLIYTYKPISPKIEQQVTDLARLWSTRRADVEAILDGSPPTPANVFADAFRFRKKDGRDG